jgi:tRNA splicing endonuclease
MIEILLTSKGDNYLLVHPSGKPFLGEFLESRKGRFEKVKHPLEISSVEKRLLDEHGNIVIAQATWQIINIDEKYFMERWC